MALPPSGSIAQPSSNGLPCNGKSNSKPDKQKRDNIGKNKTAGTGQVAPLPPS
jgi:hypothetical protein